MTIKRLLLAQAALYAATYPFLAYLGVRSTGVYVSITALIYVTTTLAFSPLPRRLRIVNYAVTAGLVAAFLYYAAMRIAGLVG